MINQKSKALSDFLKIIYCMINHNTQKSSDFLKYIMINDVIYFGLYVSNQAVFLYITKKLRQKCKYLENKIRF